MISPSPATLGPVLEFMRSLWALDHALAERAKGVGTQFGITPTQRFVVRILGQSPGTSAGAVAGILHVHPSTLTPVLQQLVARGLVRRDADPLDRRRALLWLTARGGRIDSASSVAVDARVRGALAKMAASEVFHARRVLSAIAAALTAPERAAGAPKRRPPRRAPTVTRLPARRAAAAEQGAKPVEARASRRRSAS